MLGLFVVLSLPISPKYVILEVKDSKQSEAGPNKGVGICISYVSFKFSYRGRSTS